MGNQIPHLDRSYRLCHIYEGHLWKGMLSRIRHNNIISTIKRLFSKGIINHTRYNETRRAEWHAAAL